MDSQLRRLVVVTLLLMGLAVAQPAAAGSDGTAEPPDLAHASGADPACDDKQDNESDANPDTGSKKDGKVDHPEDPGCRSALDTSENDLTGSLPCPDPGFTFEGFKGTLEEPAGHEIIRHVLVMNGQVVVDRFKDVDPDFASGTAQFTTTCSQGTKVLVTASWTVEGQKVNYTFDVKHQSGSGFDSVAKTIAAETRGGDQGGGGGGGKEEPCIPEAAFTEVDSMKNFLRKTIKRVEKGELSAKELRKRTKILDKTKLAMLRKHFPTVFGVKFIQLFRQLEEFDSRMQLVRTLVAFDTSNSDELIRKQLRKAQKELKDLEAALEEGEAVPEGAFTEIDVMENLLRKTLERVEEGQLSGKKLSKRTKQLDKMKLALVRAHFARVCGVKFVSLFRQLEEFDSRMQLVRTLVAFDTSNSDELIRKQLRKAQKELKDLEATLDGAR